MNEFVFHSWFMILLIWVFSNRNMNESMYSFIIFNYQHTNTLQCFWFSMVIIYSITTDNSDRYLATDVTILHTVTHISTLKLKVTQKGLFPVDSLLHGRRSPGSMLHKEIRQMVSSLCPTHICFIRALD